MMGGICSRKRNQPVIEDGVCRAVSGRYGKSSSSKWLTNSSFRPTVEQPPGGTGTCPSLLELCIYKICQNIDKYSSFSKLPRDVSQQIFNELVCSNSLTDVSLGAFRDCALEDILLGEYPDVKDSWMGVISSQGSSLLSVDLSGSEVTDSGLALLKGCSNLQALTYNYCDHVSEQGLKHISGLSNLTSLSFKRSDAISAEGMRAFSGLLNLEKLDLERCSAIHGGFVHLKGLKKLKSLNVRCCRCITDSDLKAISGLIDLNELQLSNCNITDSGISYLKGLHKLRMLNLEGCNVTASCLQSISALVDLAYLNLNRCSLSDQGCDKFSGE